MFIREAGWRGSRDFGFSNRDLGKRAGNFAIWTLQPGFRHGSEMNSEVRRASFYIACCIFHIISISFNCSNTAIRVTKCMIGAKVITLCFAMFALFLEFGASQELVPRIFGLFSSRKQGWNFSHYEPKAKLVPVTGLMWKVPKAEAFSIWLPRSLKRLFNEWSYCSGLVVKRWSGHIVQAGRDLFAPTSPLVIMSVTPHCLLIYLFIYLFIFQSKPIYLLTSIFSI